ncbi:hypothetical protein IQ270_28270 [Microcoleus sp. LEGE 07076]|uniref:hypothetical protein n=1 Tax=Microcoleus sp. LEGE 07076 TaxID=915322 RepID=UPI00187EAC7F|nr:hypothetical protein [Microcoleus sp. LEGE 07076]MBE9188425.1 hypothetical protein [Microcoleus sp. LEGE 07076]
MLLELKSDIVRHLDGLAVEVATSSRGESRRTEPMAPKSQIENLKWTLRAADAGKDRELNNLDKFVGWAGEPIPQEQ